MAKIPFKISARAASLIGHENIATADGAVIELVKNSYDADADDCIVFLDHSKRKKTLYIIDNGDGMDNQIIDDYWMTIGTANKLNDPRSRNKRIKTGAKGIGRFALDRLGNEASIITLPIGSMKGYQWNVKWDEFEMNKTLDQVFADLVEVEKLNFHSVVKEITNSFKPIADYLKKKSFVNGTIIKISDLKDEWSKNDIDALFKSLEILVPPIELPIFDLAFFDSLSETGFGKIDSLANEDYDYKLVAKVLKDQNIILTISRKEFNWKEIDPDVFKQKEPKNMSKFPYNLETLKKGTFSIKVPLLEFWPGLNEKDEKIIHEIGPFEFSFYYIKRTNRETEKFALRNIDTAKRRQWLDQFGGIKLYRDGFRVRPYGEVSSNSFDWLDLGGRSSVSAEGPGQKNGARWKVESQQVFGVINISRLNNPYLQDTANRAGLHENAQYFQFVDLILRLINTVELDRHYIMRPMAVVYDIKHETESNIQKANQQAEDTLAKNRRKNKGRLAFTKKTTDKDTIYAKAIKDLQKIIHQREEELRMIRVLGSVGLTLATFSHELDELNGDTQLYINKLNSFINSEFEKKSFSDIPRNKNPFLLIEEIRSLNNRISSWLEFAKTSLKKDRRKASDLHLSKYFLDFHKRWESFLETRNTQFTIIKKFGSLGLKKTYPIDMDSIFNNLLLNSMDAFFRKDSSPKREIKIDYEYEEKGLNIIYEDSGPGLLPEIKDIKDIFLPFFTTKKKEDQEVGIGLGMWIVRTTIEQYTGYIEILNSRPHFKVKLHFPKYSN
jgi:signal transduction histidine kinase